MAVKRKLLVAGIVVLVAGGLLAWQTTASLRAYKARIRDVKVGTLDLAHVADGTYQGAYDMDLVAAKLEVVVKEHKITGIRLIEHKKGTGAPAEVLLQKVVEDQSINMDVVSGSTASSKTLLKAVEDALSRAPAE